MRNIVKLISVLCLSLAMTACATKQRPYNLLDAGARPHIQKIDSVLITRQSEVGTNINASKLSKYIQIHYAPILFDMAVNGVRTYQAGQIMKPINETLDGYDYVVDIKEEFTHAMKQTDMGQMGEFKLLRHEQPGFRAAYVQQSDADAVMFIDVKFSFTPNFDKLHLASRAMVFPNNDALSAYKEKPDTDDILEAEDNIYRNQFIASIGVGTEEGGTKEENGAAWAAMSKEELTGLMKYAAAELAHHFANDMSTDDFYELNPEHDDKSQEALHDAILAGKVKAPNLVAPVDPAIASQAQKAETTELETRKSELEGTALKDPALN